MNYLQPYKGKATRHTCPSCETKQSFTLYIDGNTHEPINLKVGKCNRESKCGYHYTPKQYFMDNPMSKSSSMSPTQKATSFNTTTAGKRSSPSPSERAGVRSGEIPFSYVQKSASYKSNFVRFLFEHFSDEQIRNAAEHYTLGATRSKEVIFWQIDIHGKVRTGKIMQYTPETGKRIKHESGVIDWVHNKLKKAGALPEDFNLQQCFFGEHLLTIYPDRYIGIVESEKSAIITSCIVLDMIWLAAGNLNGLTIEKCQALKGREIILYPDLGAFEKWSIKATEIQKQCGCKVTVSTLLEDEATDTDRANGLDIADFIIAELNSRFNSNSQKIHFLPPLGESPRRLIEVRSGISEIFPEIKSYMSPSLQAMIEKNNSLQILITGLQLIEI